jgi:hypothetical protein
MSNGYDFDRATLMELFLRMQFPERTQWESAVIRDFLTVHISEYENYSFSVRVGQGLAPDPAHLPGVQRNTTFSTRKRIDMLAWQGAQPFIFEVKLRVNPAALGQLQTYQHLWLEENPNAAIPRLAAIGRTCDADTARVFDAAGVDIYLYPESAGDGGNAPSSVPADDSATA